MGARDNESDVSDAVLLRRASRGDAGSFAKLHDRHAMRLLRTITPIAGSLSADVVAETFARAWIERTRFRDRRDGSAWPWLATIARNLALDARRSEAVETRARARLGMRIDWFTEPGYERVDDSLSLPEHAIAAIGDLPPDQREALELRAVEELSYDEIGRRLAIRPAAARLRVSRAIRRILHATEGSP